MSGEKEKCSFCLVGFNPGDVVSRVQCGCVNSLMHEACRKVWKTGRGRICPSCEGGPYPNSPPTYAYEKPRINPNRGGAAVDLDEEDIDSIRRQAERERLERLRESERIMREQRMPQARPRPPRNLVEMGVGMRQNPRARNNSLNDVIDLTREFANVGLRQSPAELRARAAAYEEPFFEDERRARAAEDRARASEERARAAEERARAAEYREQAAERRATLRRMAEEPFRAAERLATERRAAEERYREATMRRETPNYYEMNRRLNEDDGAIGATARHGPLFNQPQRRRESFLDSAINAAETLCQRRIIERARELQMMIDEIESGRMRVSLEQRRQINDEIDQLFTNNQVLNSDCTLMFGRSAKKHRRTRRRSTKKRRSAKKRR